MFLKVTLYACFQEYLPFILKAYLAETQFSIWYVRID